MSRPHRDPDSKIDRQILHDEEKILHELKEIEVELHHPVAIHIRFEGATMPVTLVVGQSVPATAVETDAAGNIVVVPNPSTLVWTSSDPSVAVSPTAADGSTSYTAVSVGTSTATVTDPANSLNTTDVITVIAAPPDVATKIAITFGKPTP